VHIIRRDSLRSIESVAVGDQLHGLGLVKDLRWNEEFARNIPPSTPLSVSWVHLDAGATLAVHQHPMTSVIVVTEGVGRTLGDTEGSIGAGDVVLVPGGARHGFLGASPSGFWALSIQLEGQGIYTDPERPNVVFARDEPATSGAKLAVLLDEESRYRARFEKNLLVRLMGSPRAKDPAVSARLFDALQLWGEHFQRVLFARAARQASPVFQRMAEVHLAAEAGHDHQIARMRGGAPVRWDPVLAAASTWFLDRMHSATQEEQTVLVHLVLEGSGEIFHTAASRVYDHLDHFHEHAEQEEEHVNMALDALRGSPDLDLPRLGVALQQGWDMVELLCRRMAELALDDLPLE
jgi:quercetin dioxygenase-like cupin family protein